MDNKMTKKKFNNLKN